VKLDEYERQKKEREHRKKQEATSLEETKEQIVDLEKKLTNLKDEKHMLFLTLKKVLNEDDSRRRRDDEMYGAAPQHPQVLPLTGHTAHNQHMFMNPQSRQPGHASAHYMKPQMPGLPTHQVKRQRSPSPTRATINAVNSAYFRPSPLSHPRIPAVSSVYGHPPVASGGAPTYALSSASGGSVYPFQVSQPSREEVDRKQVYLAQPGRYMQQMESAAAAAAAAKQVSGYGRDDQRSRLAMPPSGQPVALTTSRPGQIGTISSGFPLRASAANSLINTVAPSLASRQAAAVFSAAQMVASQQGQAAAQRFYQGVGREH